MTVRAANPAPIPARITVSPAGLAAAHAAALSIVAARNARTAQAFVAVNDGSQPYGVGCVHCGDSIPTAVEYVRVLAGPSVVTFCVHCAEELGRC